MRQKSVCKLPTIPKSLFGIMMLYGLEPLAEFTRFTRFQHYPFSHRTAQFSDRCAQTMLLHEHGTERKALRLPDS